MENNVTFFRIGTITAFSNCVGKYSCDRLRYKVYIRQWCEFCGTTVNNSTGCTVKCDRVRASEGSL
jgi:hypothetical protein